MGAIWRRSTTTRISHAAGVMVAGLITLAPGLSPAATLTSVKAVAVPKVVKDYVKQRLFVLTDIEADPDDSESLVRLLLYSNDIDIEGLVATTSSPQKDRVAPETIHKILTAYGQARSNLILHDPDYPAEQRLHALVAQGPAVYGLKGVGEGKDSTGSEALIRALERPDPRPLWVSVWGGPNVLAQAAALYKKLRVYTISDQDDSGPWIRKTFPDVFYVVTPWSWGRATWGGMSRSFPNADNEVVSDSWIARNIQQGHGPLGAAYPDVAYGMEGDTPSFLGLIPNGLNEMEHPNWGGWGGRYEFYLPTKPDVMPPGGIGLNDPETRPIWTNAEDSYPPPVSGGRNPPPPAFQVRDNFVTLWRWRADYQTDFAARMEWVTKPYAQANHPPVVRINGPNAFTVKSGEVFKLDADGTFDPDGDSLSYTWFQYPEAGTYPGVVSFGGLSPRLYNVHHIIAPEVTKPETVHFILKVTDKGTPPITRYKRVIVTIVPR
jgi:hypothetical protein